MGRTEAMTQKEPDRGKAALPAPPPRLGPRPLPLHLCAAAMTWTSSPAALALLNGGSPLWSPAVTPAANGLRAALANVEPGALRAALDAEARRRWQAFLEGVMAYRAHPYRRRVAAPAEIWRAGTTRLLDYGRIDGAAADDDPADDDPADDDAVPVLVVPSLINRAYILDLREGGSLLRAMAGQGLRPFLVDWDAPGPLERGFTLTDYIAGRLEQALDEVGAITGRRPLVLGYCMGGLLALGLALRRTRDISGLALLATPWDFHADSPAQGELAAAAVPFLAPLIETLQELPTDCIQALFASLDPNLVPRKFLSFAKMDPNDTHAETFVALEDWLNDGVGLAAPVARECLAGWYGRNTTARGEWRLAGRPVEPQRLDLPTLCIVPAQDRIVPPASALALGEAIPGAAIMRPSVGHIGMVVSQRAREAVWGPLVEWLTVQADRG